MAIKVLTLHFLLRLCQLDKRLITKHSNWPLTPHPQQPLQESEKQNKIRFQTVFKVEEIFFPRNLRRYLASFVLRSCWFLVAKRLEVSKGEKNKKNFWLQRRLLIRPRTKKSLNFNEWMERKGRKESKRQIHEKYQVIGLVYGSFHEDE